MSDLTSQSQKRSQLFMRTHDETLSIEDGGGGVLSVLAVSHALTRFSDRPRSFGLRYLFAMSTDEPFRTDYELLKGVDYIFVSIDRNLSGEECHELAEKYFETHKGMTLPGQVLRVDLRPAFRKPLADVTPKFHAVSKGHTFTAQR